MSLPQPPKNTSYTNYIIREVAEQYQIYVFGGVNPRRYELDACMVFEDNKWTLLDAKMDEPRSHTTAVFLDHNTVVVCGGFDYFDKLTSKCEAFDLVSHTFKPFPSLIERRSCLSAISYNNTIVVISGFDGHLITTCEQFDKDKNKWVSFPSLNHGRMNSCATVVEDKIFVAGGGLYREDRVEMFDGVSWLVITRLIGTIYCCAMASVGTTFVVIGNKDEVHVYDIITNTWSDKTKKKSSFLD